MRWFDTHVHLADPRYDADRDAVVGRARALGVGILAAGVDLATSAASVQYARMHGNVRAAVGFYPHDAGGLSEDDWAALEGLIDEDGRDHPRAGDRRIVAVGEIGLDYHHDRVAPAVQRAAFARLLDLALRRDLAALLHCRKAEADLMPMVEDFLAKGGRAVWHCFTTDGKEMPRVVRWAAQRGLRLGVGGMATWPEEKALAEAVRDIPDALLLLETDAPYLMPRAPAADLAALRTALAGGAGGPERLAAWDGFPARAKRNEPAGVLPVAATLARLRGVDVADIARLATRNACELLRLPLPEGEALAKVAYPIRDALYVALTNRCSNDCAFCARHQSWVVKGHDVRLDHEPDADEVMRAIDAAGGLAGRRELVFCGFGEPTLALDVLVEVCRRVRAGPHGGIAIRVNTNGTAATVLPPGQRTRLVPELARWTNVVSVSLNAADAATYAAQCRPAGGAAAFDALLGFVRDCAAAGLPVVCTAVALPGLDLEPVRRLALSLGATFRRREFDQVG